MITAALQWTDAAREGLERYFAARLTPSRLEGADAAEVRTDLLAHLGEDLSAEGVAVVTLEDLRRTLARMGESLPPPLEEGGDEAKPAGFPGDAGAEPEAVLPRTGNGNVESPMAGAGPERKKARENSGAAAWPEPMPWKNQGPGKPVTSHWITWMALWLPLATFLFEVVTRGCVGVLFDPMPDWEHHVLVLLVPLAGWMYLRSESVKGPVWLGRVLPWVAGAALAVSFFYMLCFLPVVPAAVPGIILAGTGLLALAPLLAFTAMLQMRRRIKKFGEPGSMRPLRLTFWLTLLVMAGLEVPVVLTESAVNYVAHPSPSADAWAYAAKTVRRFGSEKVLLRSTVRAERGPTSLVRGILMGAFNKRGDPGLNASPAERMAASRELYYRVTGIPFDGTPVGEDAAPLLENEFNRGWGRSPDEDRGGERVAGRIAGLTLGQSRMDWHCEDAAGLTWGEWTLTFTNSSRSAEEARCRIALPPGGFVSRVTLWVNGEPQEAAYSTVSRVRAAYQAVAVKERRDPVLVTQPDAGSIMVQAFPVPAGGQLKTRISFTVPAAVDGSVWLPSLMERNFEVEDGSSLPLWVQADRGTLELPAVLNPRAAMESGAPTVTGFLRQADFMGLGISFVWRRQQAAPVVFCEDPFAAGPDRKIIVRRETGPQTFQPGAVAWVIDTSAPMASRRAEIAQALTRFPVPGKTAFFLPGATARNLVSSVDGSLPAMEFEGGRDNTPALCAALEWLRGQPGACLVWIHGPQPLDGEMKESLNQLLDRGASPLTVVDLAVSAGEDRISPALIGRSRIQVLSARAPTQTTGGDENGKGLADALEGAFRQRGGTFSTLAAGTPPPDGAVRVSDGLARWMAREEAFRLGLEHPAEASVMAATHQIVTPWSGAVVLEKAEDYTKNNLTQADAANAQVVPTIPEPSGALLALLSASHFLFRRRRAGA